MRPEGKEYEKEVNEPKVWELINDEHHLVTKKVSDYIRGLESDLESTRKLLSDSLKKCNHEFVSSVAYKGARICTKCNLIQ